MWDIPVSNVDRKIDLIAPVVHVFSQDLQEGALS
jgi:hypothetical protein